MAVTRQFQIDSGTPCLDFANTLEGRAEDPPRDDGLSNYSDLVGWSLQAGLIDKELAVALLREASRRPEAAEQVVAEALRLREAIFRMFASVAAGGRADAADLETLNERLARTLGNLRVSGASDQPCWTWRADRNALDRVLWPVARDAADLLVSNDAERVRECASATCRWLFLDGSRNQSRRWCDMKVCGNRAKVRRHYRKKTAAGKGG